MIQTALVPHCQAAHDHNQATGAGTLARNVTDIMNPLEILDAAAARLVQEGAAQRGALGVRLTETAASIRGAVATIRAALAPADDKLRKKQPRERLIVGDEDRP